jgi:hypothetical protein
MEMYKQQFARVCRYLDRVRDPNRNENTNDYTDDIWSFFQNAWHLKDWISNDKSLDPGVREKLKDAIHKSTKLQICQGLANRTKHDLETHAETAKPGPIHTMVNLGPTPTTNYKHMIVLFDGQEIVAQDFAEEVVSTWRTILCAAGLRT